MAKISPWLVIGLVVVLAVALSGESIWGFWGQLWNFGQEQGQYGSIGLGITIRFADGTVEEYKPSGSWLLPLTILIDGEPIESITWAVWLKADWTGTLTSLDASGEIEVWTQSHGPIWVDSAPIMYNGVPTKNDWTLIESLIVTDTQMESVLTSSVAFWVLEGTAQSTMIFNFADNESTTMTPELGPTQVHIAYQSGALTIFQIDLTSSYI